MVLILIAASGHLLRFSYPAFSGLWLGLGSMIWSWWLMLPWQRESSDYLKAIGVGALIRLTCVTAIAIWGFRYNFQGGLAGIISFGLGFALLTLVENRKRK